MKLAPVIKILGHMTILWSRAHAPPEKKKGYFIQ